jgi:excinuclease ABC subunit A
MPDSTTISSAAIAGNPVSYKHFIHIKGARSNNLQNIEIFIPKNKLVVVTGVSGSGKSSLVIDTLYSEGQRRYVESLSSYARQFLDRMKKPEVDFIKGICPAIAIETKSQYGKCQIYGGISHRNL